MSYLFRSARTRHAALNTALLCGTLAAGLAAQTPAAAAPKAPVARGPVVKAPVAAERVFLSGHASRAALASPMLGAEPDTATMSLAVSLPLRNQALLDDTLRRLYDPADPLYKHFLTLDEYTAQFGPTQAQYDAVTKFLTDSGMTVAQTFAGRTQIDVTGPVSSVNAAFGLQIKRFLAADGTTFRAADTNVSIPAALAGSISAVTGLDGSLKATPAAKFTPISDPDTGSDALVPQATQPTQGTGIGNTFSYSDIKTAYNLNSTTLNGAGQNVGLVEFDSFYNPKDILLNSAAIGTRPHIQNVFVNSGGIVTQANGNALEIDLDIDEAASLAPKSLITVYMVPFNNGQGALDEFQQIINDNSTLSSGPKSVSASYGFGEEDPAGLDPTFDIPLDNLLKQMGMLGVSFFISSGDSGSSTDRGTFVKGVDRFGALPDSCTVGGTQLSVVTPKSNENYLSETTWNINNTPGGGAGGGGFSINWSIPSYQVPAVAAASPQAALSTTMRNIPDVSLNASQATGYAVRVSDYPTNTPGVYQSGTFRVGGTSASAPLWAGFVALVNQNSLRNGGKLLGFPNPSLYTFGPGGKSAALYNSVFHDVNDLSTNSTDNVDLTDTQFLATTGFDDATGLGSFNGQPLIQALSGPTP